MFEFLFLGTSASAPSVHRGLSSHLVKHRDYRFLIDAGEGTQRQILRSGAGFKRLDKILITHGHLDHILGLGGLMSTLARWDTMEKIEIWAGQHALDRISDLLFKVVLPDKGLPIKIDLIPLETGVIMEDDKFSLSAFPVVHRGRGCFGFSFEQKTHVPFLNDKATDLGVPFGPERGQLVKGNAVTLADGSVITPEDVMGDPIKGVKLVHVGDVGNTAKLLPYVQDADALVIESTYLDEDKDMAKKFGHLTATQAANLAVEANVKQLYLTHISRRYREKDVIREAQAIFPNAVVARDFTEFSVKREK